MWPLYTVMAGDQDCSDAVFDEDTQFARKLIGRSILDTAVFAMGLAPVTVSKARPNGLSKSPMPGYRGPAALSCLKERPENLI